MQETVANLIDRLADLKSKKTYIESDLKNVESLIKDVEGSLMEKMDSEGINKSASSAGSVTIGESIVPQVEDWDKFYNYIWENKYFHLLERRPTVTGFRELYEMGRPVPGVLPFKKRRVTFKST